MANFKFFNILKFLILNIIVCFLIVFFLILPKTIFASATTPTEAHSAETAGHNAAHHTAHHGLSEAHHEGESPVSVDETMFPAAPLNQTWATAQTKSTGCQSCHTNSDQKTMHSNPAVVLGCTDCHGGNANIFKPFSAQKGDPTYRQTQDQAHVLPRYPQTWGYPGSANPNVSYTLLNKESKAFVRFMNPSDLRVARYACGACHLPIIQANERSLMSTGAMLWGGASYNNGILPFKRYILGESYTEDGEAASILGPVKPDENMTRKGIIGELFPLPAWETIPPADVFRVFERGGRNIGTIFPETGLPNSLGLIQRLEEPGRPDLKQSNRGPGTGSRIAVPALNIHKTRLNDPFLWFLGTNDQPGDYRSSGCASCHVIYANDREPRHSGNYARFGHEGLTQTNDPTIPRDISGHPLKHEFTRAIPTSQCMVCHMHQPNIFLNSMLGYTMWDYESDAPQMWPESEKNVDEKTRHEILKRNPEEAAIRGKWGEVDFLKKVWELNPQMKDTQFADYHGHGWNFRAIFKRDREGRLLDKDGNIVSNDDPQKFKKAVHLSSVHVDVGMHCVDCHFAQDNHGSGHMVGEVAQSIEIECADCHGTADNYPNLKTSGPAAPTGGHDLSLMRTPDGRKRFEWINGKLFQRSNLDPNKEWQLSLVKDTMNPNSAEYNPKAARAKLMSQDTRTQYWGTQVPATQRAHRDDKMLCVTCHTSWTTSCAGCHLPIQANAKTERHHYEGGETRNFATYNPQVARDDMYMLGIHGEAKGNRIAPVRSTSALVLSSTNSNRERIYIQQPPVAASGYSSQAFAPHFPHTERKTETKTCTDCHLSANNDNNAIMAQLFTLGTNFVNFMGFNAWVGSESQIAAVQVTEWDEPQAVIGSYLHKYAYPARHQSHQTFAQQLQEVHTHKTGGAADCLQLRGEYLYVAQGTNGMQAYDVASIANKGFSERIITAPFSPLGQNAKIRSKDASCIALPTNQPIAPWKNEGALMRETNQEQPFHPIYHYAAITDREEGLILVNVDTLQDGDPRNNDLTRAVTWNPDGILNGARHITLAGHIAYITTPTAVVIVSVDDPLNPKALALLKLDDPRATFVQFRYLFVTTQQGLQVVDVTLPNAPKALPSALIALEDAQKVTVTRTYAYVAAGAQGLAIVNVTNPEQPKLYQLFNANGALNDARDVAIAATNASLFAYIADGKNGLKVVQLTSPASQPNFYGFSPEPKPELIAWRALKSPALALSRGLERDRGVDETGHQVAVFGRIGSRPFNLAEMQKLYLNPNGQAWFVRDNINITNNSNINLNINNNLNNIAPPKPAPSYPPPRKRRR